MHKICFILFFQIANAFAISVSFDSSMSDTDKKILNKTFLEIEGILPSKMIAGLPKNIVVSLDKLNPNQKMPGAEICLSKNAEENKNRFVYGFYNKSKNALTLNPLVLAELEKGETNSQKINCQHGSIYKQAMVTIIHELTHAFDLNQDNISSTKEFLRLAGFKKGLIKIKNKNSNPMRSADLYELKNSAESFAVNMEYFLLDEEYACRKPSLFKFYKNLLGIDPFINRHCQLNKTVMMSSRQGFVPVVLDIKRVYRIDYLLAAPGTDISSGFGHSMFRLVICAPERIDVITQKIIPATVLGPECLKDKLYHLVVSYRANVEDATLNYYKGIFGGYPSTLFILNFADVLDEYNKDELRDVKSYPLKFSLEDKKDFINRVIEEHWNYQGSYKFFTNNCAVESQDLLNFSVSIDGLNEKNQ